ncbi:uncharacterized protein LOC144151528 isoform X4 [Haemaphysalis longicornis]
MVAVDWGAKSATGAPVRRLGARVARVASELAQLDGGLRGAHPTGAVEIRPVRGASDAVLCCVCAMSSPVRTASLSSLRSVGRPKTRSDSSSTTGLEMPQPVPKSVLSHVGRLALSDVNSTPHCCTRAPGGKLQSAELRVSSVRRAVSSDFGASPPLRRACGVPEWWTCLLPAQTGWSREEPWPCTVLRPAPASTSRRAHCLCSAAWPRVPAPWACSAPWPSPARSRGAQHPVQPVVHLCCRVPTRRPCRTCLSRPCSCHWTARGTRTCFRRKTAWVSWLTVAPTAAHRCRLHPGRRISARACQVCREARTRPSRCAARRTGANYPPRWRSRTWSWLTRKMLQTFRTWRGCT